MGDLLANYEEWVLSVGTRPTVSLFLAIFVALAIIGFFGYRRGSRSFRAWFWFSLANVGAWAYLYWGGNLSQENNDHVRLFLIHFTLITGPCFCVALALRILGGEKPARKDVSL